jgi:predicted Zn-dependent protease with MMP-like domain
MSDRTKAPSPVSWSRAPSLAEIEEIAHRVFDALPEKFRAPCDGLIIRVDEFPSDDILDEFGADTLFDLMGLFQGVGVPFRHESDPVQMPNMIWLYRRPILDYWASHDDTLEAIVRHVLVHEIGHHFGMSDSDMEAIEKAAD